MAAGKRKRKRRTRARRRNRVEAVQSFDLAAEIEQKRLRCVAVVSAMNEEETIGQVVQQLYELPLAEVVVVANGCADRTASIAKERGARLIELAEPLGHDVGRAMGAAHADADVYLFTDGDLVIPAQELEPFLACVVQGADIALNDLNSLVRPKGKTHVVNVCKLFLNHALGVPELGINSLTAIPHCLSRRAVDVIGAQNLAVPPKAMVIARLRELKIERAREVDVIRRNRFRPDVHQSHFGPVDELILGDHLEAIAHLLHVEGMRGGFHDYERQRVWAERRTWRGRLPGS